MTAKDLIAQLKTVPPNAHVLLENSGKEKPTITMPDYVDALPGNKSYVVLVHG